MSPSATGVVLMAVATGRVTTTAAPAIADGSVPKGDVFRPPPGSPGSWPPNAPPDLIPMCHPIAVHGVEIELVVDEVGVGITATVRTADRTGVEMEALTAVSVAALTIIDMTKALDPAAMINDVRVERKTGGRSGEWSR